jgi:uncharacterized protein
MKSCMFLRKNNDGDGTTCAIYPTRPKVCRDFRCYRMLIRTCEGTNCGRVIGKNTIRTEDVALKNLWKCQVAVIPFKDFAAWTRTVAGILAEYGYCADPVQ